MHDDGLFLLSEIKAQGLDIQTINGDLHVRPSNLITDRIRLQIGSLKHVLVDFLEAFEERAAIKEFEASDCYSRRQEAEQAAQKELLATYTPTGFSEA